MHNGSKFHFLPEPVTVSIISDFQTRQIYFPEGAAIEEDNGALFIKPALADDDLSDLP